MEYAEEKKRRKIIMIILFLLLVLLGALAYNYFQRPVKVISGLPQLEENASKITNKDMLKQMQVEVDKNNLKIILNHEIAIDSTEKLATVDIVNSAANNYSIQVKYVLNETDKVIYESGLIHKNHHVLKVKMYNLPDIGTHKVKIYYSIYDKDKLINIITFDGEIKISCLIRVIW